MQQIPLKAAARGIGKGEAHRIREEGSIPGVLYGHGVQGLPIRVNAREFGRVLGTGAGRNNLVELQLDGDKHTAMIKEIQQDYLRSVPLHVDFYRISLSETIKAVVPLVIVGAEVVVKEGGIVEHQLHEVEVECLPTDIPEHIEVDVSRLRVGHHLTVADLKVPAGVAVLNDPVETVVVVDAPRGEGAEEGEAKGGGSAEPELVAGKGKKEEE